MSNYEKALAALESEGRFLNMTAGVSMKPLLRTGKDIVSVVPLNRKIRNNDVILYRRSGTDKLVLHRVVKVKKDGIEVLGDNTYTRELDIMPDDILGVMDGFFRSGKYHSVNEAGYKLYVFFMRLSYPARLLRNRIIWHFKKKKKAD